jgi:PAS domain-containing protein
VLLRGHRWRSTVTLPPGLEQFARIIIDSYFVIDLEHNIVEFNRAFHSTLPRALARNLTTKKCYEVLRLDICKDKCIARQCWKSASHVRLDEIHGQLSADGPPQRFILSAIPISDSSGQVIGAMEVQRNVTDEALVQVKYQQQVETSAKQQARLEQDLQSRTSSLLEVSRRLYSTQRELVRAKTELFG